MNILTKIELKVLEKEDDYIKFKISHQTEDLRNPMGLGIDILTTPDIKIMSSGSPEVMERTKSFFLRGTCHELDHKELTCSKEFYDRIQKAISMINSKEFLY